MDYQILIPDGDYCELVINRLGELGVDVSFYTERTEKYDIIGCIYIEDVDVLYNEQTADTSLIEETHVYIDLAILYSQEFIDDIKAKLNGDVV